MPQFNHRVLYTTGDLPVAISFITDKPIPNTGILSTQEAEGFLAGMRITSVKKASDLDQATLATYLEVTLAHKQMATAHVLLTIVGSPVSWQPGDILCANAYYVMEAYRVEMDKRKAAVK